MEILGFDIIWWILATYVICYFPFRHIVSNNPLESGKILLAYLVPGMNLLIVAIMFIMWAGEEAEYWMDIIADRIFLLRKKK